MRVIVTAGGTQEPIDPVRYISNRSSGKMGFALAREAANRGAAVTLVTAPTALPVPDRVDVVHVRTAQEMRDAVVARFDEADVVVKAAAVADFKAKTVAGGKIKKANAPSAIELEPTIDIAAELGAMKKDQILVGFAAETDDHVAAARKKLATKNLDLIVLNDVRATNAGFEVDTNRAGQVWHVRITDNRQLVLSRNVTTRAPSGSFTVRPRTGDRAGTDVIRAHAFRGDRVCGGLVRI